MTKIITSNQAKSNKNFHIGMTHICLTNDHRMLDRSEIRSYYHMLATANHNVLFHTRSPNSSSFFTQIKENHRTTPTSSIVNKLTFRHTYLNPGLGSIQFFQFNSNSNSVIFNSNSNSTTHNKFQFQFQFQFRRFQFQFQFQFRRFQIPAISILEMTCWCLPWNWL